jgi:hypothetical protein
LVEITNKEYIALYRFNVGDVKEYSQWLEAFAYGRIINDKLIKNLEKFSLMIDDTIPNLIMYFSESLPYLRKARTLLVTLVQRKKATELGYPQLESLFVSNLQNINSFFQRFGITVEELSQPPSIFSNDTDLERNLSQKLVNPNYDNSPQLKATVKKMVKSLLSNNENCTELKAISGKIIDDYNSGNIEQSEESKAVSQLFLEGIANLYNRDREYQLSRDRVEELSKLAEAEMTPRQRKIKKLLAEATNNVISETRGF